MTSRYFFAVLFIFLISLGAKASTYWNDIPESNIQTSGERVIHAERFRTLNLNIPEISALLQSAPDEANVHPKNSNTIITLPMPDGRNLRFRFVYSPVMHPELAAKFPEIRTYLGQGIDDPYSSVRFDLTPNGFHAMIFSESGTVFIDPYARGDNFNYMSYFKADFRTDKKMTCEVIETPESNNIKHAPQNPDVVAEGQLRTYRTVVACTGEYAAYYGGTVNGAMAGIVASVNRVSGVYVNEFSVKLELVANNNLVVYTNASSDPYSNNNGSTMLGQNQTTCDQIIGPANYDMGHVFSTGGGGVANLSCVCTSSKARGVTGSGAPVGDPFDIDYVAHEMGHQFGGNHSFNSTTSSCGGGNRNNNTAFEPGSGSTIMAYAGICGADNLQPNSDAYFHTKNLDEIISYSSIGGGNSCPVTTNTGNHNPVVTVPDGGFAIPISTPFELTGSATDQDNDPLKYCWEQYDLGPAGTANNPSGNAPIFRSFNPVTSGTRIFPKLSDLLNNTQTIGERLPTYARGLTFRLTARDYRAGGGGTGNNTIAFGVDATAGPFLVTSPNTAVTLNSNLPQVVTWNVANTNLATVNCANVSILLSTDGGNTWGTTLSASTPNIGTAVVNLPSIQNSTCRIKIKAVGNIFYDISNTNFTITNLVGIGNNSSAPLTFSLAQNFPNPFNPSTLINFTIPKMSNVTLNVYDMKGQLVASLINQTMTEGNYRYEFDGSQLASGMYFYKIEAGAFAETKKMILMK